MLLVDNLEAEGKKLMLKVNNNNSIKRILFHKSSIGYIRNKNEDYAFSGTNSVLDSIAIACDGVGSFAGSDIAAEIVSKTFITSFYNLEYITMPIETWFTKNIEKAKLLMCNHVKKNPFHQEMCTTLVVSILVKNKVHVFWIGDSRAYLVSKKESEQLTVDHNLLNYLLEKNASEETIKKFQKNLGSITNSVSIDMSHEQKYGYTFKKFKKNSFVFLATDGFYNFFDMNSLYDIISVDFNKEKISEEMLQRSILNGSNDNISFAYFGMVKE